MCGEHEEMTAEEFVAWAKALVDEPYATPTDGDPFAMPSDAIRRVESVREVLKDVKRLAPREASVYNATGKELAVSVCEYDGLHIYISNNIADSNHATAQIVPSIRPQVGTWTKLPVVKG
jgi:hypothetical protein